MNLKTVGIIIGVILFIFLLGIVGFKMTEKTEGYKAENQEFYSLEPHYGLFGGCATYKVMQAEKANRQVIRKGVKPKQDLKAAPIKAEVKK